MLSYEIQKGTYAELWCMSTDTKPTGIGAVPNASKLTEIDTSKVYRFNGDTGEWFDTASKYPIKLEVASNAYKVTYSDNTTKTQDVEVEIRGEKAYYIENSIEVSCDAITITVAVVGDTETVTYDGEEHTASGYTATPDKDVYTSSDFEFDGEAVAKRTEVGKTMMGLTAEMFANKNDQYIVTFDVTDGYVEIESAEEPPADDNGGDNTEGGTKSVTRTTKKTASK